VAARIARANALPANALARIARATVLLAVTRETLANARDQRHVAVLQRALRQAEPPCNKHFPASDPLSGCAASLRTRATYTTLPTARQTRKPHEHVPWVSRRDLTEAIRAHLFRCPMLPSAIRLRAQELRDAGQRLVKESQQRRDRSDVVIREAEAALFRAQRALREATPRTPPSPAFLHRPSLGEHLSASLAAPWTACSGVSSQAEPVSGNAPCLSELALVS
jgi:hypothetical protein